MTQTQQEEPREPDELLAVDHITLAEWRRLQPRREPLPADHELDSAECPNCGEPWDDDTWKERHSHGGPSLGEDWYYTCPNCHFEVFEVGT